MQAGTLDIKAQGRFLNEVARVIGQRTLRTTLSQVLSPINSTNLRQAYASPEQGMVIGKVVLKGF